MVRRNGMTLMEVLVAIFVMGIGLLSVLAMFPMGSVTMSRAIRDDRAAHGVANAKAIGAAMNVRFDTSVASSFTNPNPGVFSNAPLNGPSYPVYADPVGNQSYSSGFFNWVAGNSTNGIVRRPVSFATTPVTMLKYCAILDDITFGPNAQPLQTTGGVERSDGITWAWLLQRPQAGNPNCCNMAVVVYSQRPLSTGIRLSAREVSYPSCTVDPTQANLITMNWGTGSLSPQVKEGGWVLDATPNTSGGKVAPGNATFYYVDKVNDVIGNSVVIELREKLQGTATTRTMVVMEGVVDVLDCGPGWRSGNN